MRTILVGLAIFAALPALAQTVLQVPYDKAGLYWDAAQDPPPAGVGPTEWYVVNCGGPDVRVDVPAHALMLPQIIAGPGRYTCTVIAFNGFGQSSAATFPVFEAGYGPANVDNVRIEIAP